MESVVELGKKGATHRFTTAHYLKKKKKHHGYLN